MKRGREETWVDVLMVIAGGALIAFGMVVVGVKLLW